MISYPTYRFSRAGAQVRVETKDEDRALKGEWFDHPPTEASDPIVLDDDDPTDETDTMVEEETASEGTPSRRRKKK